MIIQNESERKFITDILASDPDAELREEIRQTVGNGEYATQFCRNCKTCKFAYDGNIATAKIINSCNRCKERLKE